MLNLGAFLPQAPINFHLCRTPTEQSSLSIEQFCVHPIGLIVNNSNIAIYKVMKMLIHLFPCSPYISKSV